MTRVLVCGGRSYSSWPRWAVAIEQARAFAERGIMCRALDDARAQGIALLIEGGATGADAYCRQWAIDHGVETLTFRADWKTHGRAAGPLRNSRMIAEGKPDLVIGFPGDRGTEDMIRKAEAAGIPVRRIVTSPQPDRSA